MVFNSKEAIDKDGEMVVVVNNDDSIVATRGSRRKHHQQVLKVFHLIMDSDMGVGIDKCIFDSKEVSFLRFVNN